jgi:TRAP-type C4-dicarboxylate transport system permease small subunit
MTSQEAPLRAKNPTGWENALVRTNQAVLIALMALMALLVFTNVVSRYAFNHSFVWAEELSRYMMIWVAFLGSGLVLRAGAHIAVDVFQDMMPRRIAQAMRVGVVAVMLVCIVAMGILGTQYAIFAWGQQTPILNWNFGVIYMVIPAGAVLMLLHLLLIAKSFILERSFPADGGLSSEEATL